MSTNPQGRTFRMWRRKRVYINIGRNLDKMTTGERVASVSYELFLSEVHLCGLWQRLQDEGQSPGRFRRVGELIDRQQPGERIKIVVRPHLRTRTIGRLDALTDRLSRDADTGRWAGYRGPFALGKAIVAAKTLGISIETIRDMSEVLQREIRSVPDAPLRFTSAAQAGAWLETYLDDQAMRQDRVRVDVDELTEEVRIRKIER